MKTEPTRFNARVIDKGKVIQKCSKLFADEFAAYQDAHSGINALSGIWVEIKQAPKVKSHDR